MVGFKAQIDELKTRLGHHSFKQKVLLGVVAAASVISVAVFGVWLLMDDSAVHRLRGDLAAGGVPSSGAVGFVNYDDKVFSATMADDESGRTASQLALRKEVESYLGEKASSMLDGVLGAGRSIVRVNAALNFEKIDKEREFFDPAATVVRSEVRNEETNPATGGNHENSTTTYEINRTVEHIVGHTGGIETLSVAVFVDGTYETSEEGVPTYQPLGEDELGQLRRIVQTAVGLNAVRGDQIEVVNMQFQQEQAGSLLAPYWVGLLTQYGGKVVLLIALMVITLSLKRNIGSLLADTSAGTGRDKGRQRGAAALQEDHESFDGLPGMDDLAIGDIQDYAAENPERVADVIQSWIREGDIEGNAKQAVGD